MELNYNYCSGFMKRMYEMYQVKSRYSAIHNYSTHRNIGGPL